MRGVLVRDEKEHVPTDGMGVHEILAHYEKQSEEEAVAEDEVTAEDLAQTLMEVPNELVPKVRELIARKAS